MHTQTKFGKRISAILSLCIIFTCIAVVPVFAKQPDNLNYYTVGDTPLTVTSTDFYTGGKEGGENYNITTEKNVKYDNKTGTITFNSNNANDTKVTQLFKNSTDGSATHTYKGVLDYVKGTDALKIPINVTNAGDYSLYLLTTSDGNVTAKLDETNSLGVGKFTTCNGSNCVYKVDLPGLTVKKYIISLSGLRSDDWMPDVAAFAIAPMDSSEPTYTPAPTAAPTPTPFIAPENGYTEERFGYNDHGLYLYMGQKSTGGNGSVVSSNSGTSPSNIKDLDGKYVAQSENLNGSGSTITYPSVNLDGKYNKVAIYAAQGNGEGITAILSVGGTQVTDESITIKNEGWGKFTENSANLTDTNASGQVKLEITVPSTGMTNTFAGNYVHIRFYYEDPDSWLGDLTYFDTDSISKEDSKKSRDPVSDTTTYAFESDVDAKAKTLLCSSENPNNVASKYSDTNYNYLGNITNSSSGGNPVLTGLNIKAGAYKIYYLGENKSYNITAQIYDKDGNPIVGSSETVDPKTKSSLISKGNKGLRLYTFDIKVNTDIEGAKLKFTYDAEAVYMPNLYQVIIEKIDPGFGEGTYDSGVYIGTTDENPTVQQELGVIRFLQAFTGTDVTEFGFVFINGNDGTVSIKADANVNITQTGAIDGGGFYGDLDAIENLEATYYAKPYVIIGGQIYYGGPISATVAKNVLIEYSEQEATPGQ